MHFSFENLMFDLIWWEDRWLIVIDLCNLMPNCNLQFHGVNRQAIGTCLSSSTAFEFNIVMVFSTFIPFDQCICCSIILHLSKWLLQPTKNCTVYSRINPNSDQTELNKMLYFRRFKSAPSVIHILIVIDCVLHETAHNLIVRLWSIPIFFDMNKQYFS